jgi:two-component system, cell cycle response regulator
VAGTPQHFRLVLRSEKIPSLSDKQIGRILVTPDRESPKMKVLAAEDNPVFQSMLRTMLTKWGYEAIMARDGLEALRTLESEDGPRLAILDWMMPGIDGVELCRRIRAAAREPYVYIVLLTARTEAQDLVEGMESGADDYLTKPFHPHELRVRLRAGTRILQLQDQLVQAREALRFQATHDGLTGMLNRASILEALANELARAGRNDSSVAVLLADIDRFKAINDTRGHFAGDAVLREAGQRMKSVMRRYDSMGRYGGEEFLIVLPGCDGNAATQQARRIVEAFGGSPFSAGDLRFSVTCSVGVSYRAPAGELDADALIREADAALYKAKSKGRNRVEMAERDSSLLLAPV